MQLPFKATMNQAEGYPIKIFQNIINHASLAVLSPFLIRYDAKERKFVADSKFYRKILVAFVHISIFGHYFLQFHERLQTKDRVQYWTKILSNISFGWYLTIVLYTIWFKQNEVMDFLNQMRALCDHLNQKGFLRIRKRIIWVLKMLLPAAVIIYGVTLILPPAPNRKGQVYYNGTKPKSIFLIQNLESITFHACYALSARIIIRFLLNAFTIFGFLVLLGVSLSLWLIIEGFETSLQKKSSNAGEIQYVLDTLLEISKVFGSCGRAFGNLYAQVGLTFIPILAVECPHLFNENIIEGIEFVADATILVTTLVLAASCNSLIKSVQTWIYQSMSTDFNHAPRYFGDSLQFRITLLMSRIDADQFGISGHYFVITYGFFGTVCGLVITYALVISQLDNR